MSDVRRIYAQMGGIFQVDRKDIIEKAQTHCPVLEELSPRTIRLVEVKTYIQSVKTFDAGTFPGIAVPPFASHWGVVVDGLLYHLTFSRNPAEVRNESSLKDFARHGKPIEFTVTRAKKDMLDKSESVGVTKFGSRELIEIGDALIEAFGNYHRLFWNCQVFADCFLELITGQRFPE